MKIVILAFACYGAWHFGGVLYDIYDEWKSMVK